VNNLPGGVTDRDIDRRFGERIHEAQCPQHESWQGPTWACADDHMLRAGDLRPGYLDAQPPACPVWYSDGERCGQPMREIECACDQLAQAYAEDAAEHAREENEGR